ncbi:MAG TPA: hypothetical protein VE631_10490 [Alphaproteobacteria bacterium]|nr:hypothetical protein [Alphaproteobacteria bacterium]
MKAIAFGAKMAATAVVLMGWSATSTAIADPTVEQLDNPGAEDGVLAPWVSDPAGAADSVFFLFANSGNRVFSAFEETVTAGGQVVISQDVDVSGCGVEGLDGSFSADGFANVRRDDTGQLAVNLDDGSSASGAILDALLNPLAWQQLGPVTGPISADAAVATVSMTSTDVDEDEEALLRYDDMSFRITCVADFAKISGTKEMHGGKGGDSKDKGPVWTFGGTVGHMDDEDSSLAGTISINYRELGPSSCEFTPTSITYTSPFSVAIEADYECTGGDKDGATGTATIALTARDASGCSGAKDRGSVAVSADDSDLDIFGSSGETGEENCLATGNVIIVPPPA